MNLKKIIAFFLLAGTLCACSQSKETGITATPAGLLTMPLSTPEATVTGLPENRDTPSLTPEVTITMLPEMTGTPSITEAPGNSPVPSVTETPTMKPDKELIPIDEAHFTSVDFRKIISAKYDTDGDGCLSRTEREAVCLIHWDYFDLLQEGFILEEEAPDLDGLGYFPNLRFLTVRKAGKILLQDHPSVRGLQVEEGGAVAYVQIERCPLFQFISNPFSIKSCYIADAAPEILLEAIYGNSVLYKSILYGGLNIYNPERFPGLTAEEENRIFGREPLKEWVGKTENGRAFSKELWERYLLGQEINFYEVSVAENTEEPSDMHGKKGWLAVVDHYDASDMGVSCFPFYTDEIPDADSIRISIGEISKIIQLNYEADRGCILSAECSLKVVYQGKEGEELLGIIQEKLYQCVIEEDTVRITPYRCQGLEVTPDSDGERIPIDGEHFSSKVFQRYLEEKYPANAAEGLSTDIREDIMVMDFSGSVRFAGETIDGLEYFPNLTDLYLGHTGTLVVENHPSLEVIGGDAPGLKKLVVRNCPELRRIDLDLSKIEEVVIEGCGKLDELIPIDEAHFTSEAFREYIYETYDKDRDGMLSAKEREAVKEIDLQSFGEMRFLNETLDGFEQFPCLEAVLIGLTGKVIIQGHPAIKFFGGTENAVQEVIIADCPALERIGFYLSDLGNISVKNCPELKEFSVENGDVDNADTVWEFLGTPRLIFDSDTAPGRLVLDADAALRAYYGTYQPEFFMFDEERQLCYCGTRVEWVNRSEINMPASVSPEMEQQLEEKALQIYRLVSIVEGRKNNRLAVLKKLSEAAPVYVRFYSEKEQPEFKDFSFSCDGKAVIDVYSPNRAVTQHWEGWISLVYEEDGEKQELFHWKEKTAPITLFADGSTMEYDSWNQWMGMSTGTAERLPEEKRISIAVGDNYAAYLDEAGGLHILYAPEEIMESVDLEKKYTALGTDASTLVTIDEEGKLWAYFPFTAEEVEEGIRQGLEDAAKYGGNFGLGSPSPEIIRSFAELSGVRQVVSDYPFEYTVLLEDGTMSSQSHLNGEARFSWDGAVLKEIAVPETAGAAAGITEDGTFVFQPTGWEREKKLKEWPEKLKQICAGNGLVGLTEDGMVIAEEAELDYIINMVEKWSGISQVAAQGGTVVGMKEDGTVVAVCTLGNDKGQCAVGEWCDIVAVGTNGRVTVGVRKDGSFVTTEEENIPK